MNTPASSDVIVVGGGPAGSATAMLLAARGHSVTLLDRARFPRDKACSEFMSPAATEALQRIGVLGALEREPSARPAALRISTHAGHALVGCFSAAPVAPWRSDGLALRRDRLDACLLEAAADAGVRVCEGWSFDGVVREHDAVTGVVAHDRRTPVAGRAVHRWPEARAPSAHCVCRTPHRRCRPPAWPGRDACV